MGILDDAIREHLDLKRRQGAEEDELQRLQDEAFGPPSRPGDPDFPDAEAAEGASEMGESPMDAEPLSDEHPTASEPVVAESAAPGPVAPEPVSEPPGGGFYDQSDDEQAAASDVREPPGGPPPLESLDTVEHPFEDAIEDTGEADAVQEPLPAQPAPSEEPLTEEEEVVEGELTDADEGEDVLEETPEFLREQPEDDELWFEQGEPKDFDF
jgi:hypothetical protein